MSQTEKAALFRELKEAGVKFDRHYREYSTAELQEAVDALRASQPAPTPQAEPDFDPAAMAAAYDRVVNEAQEQSIAQPPAAPQPELRIPTKAADPDELPGQRLNQGTAELEPIRRDEQGRIWYQEEVRKPAFPKPRGRRVLKYMDSGVKTETAKDGKYVETFEVAGDRPAQATEAKITLPSYQVGIYKDPRFPFKIHVYNGRQGFDLFEVQNYYGGAELVPMEIKRVYVENVLCYDIRTTVRAIQTEYRQLQLQGKV